MHWKPPVGQCFVFKLHKNYFVIAEQLDLKLIYYTETVRICKILLLLLFYITHAKVVLPLNKIKMISHNRVQIKYNKIKVDEKKDLLNV